MNAYLQVFASWRMAVVMVMGFSSGLPLALTASGSVFQAWMTSENVDLTLIGIFSLVGLPYSLKFLWSPILDRYVPPFLGRRRGWMVIAQLGLMIALICMAFSNPAANPFLVAFLALCVAFFSASQDILVDAYRVEVLNDSELGAGAAVYILGYRIAMLVSGALALMLADHIPWRWVYLVMAFTMLVGVLAAVTAPEPEVKEKPPSNLKEAVVLPFLEYFRRRGAIEMLAFILLYKLDVVMTLAMTTPFMLQLGFTKTDIGAVTKGFGMVATIAGAFVGGSILAKAGIKRSLWLFGILQGASTFTFMLLARAGHHYPIMVSAITLENFCSGMGTSAFAAFMMSICNKKFTATQYALLSSLMALTRVVVGAPTGFLAKSLGWEFYYVICMLAAIPGLLILTRYDRWVRS